MKLVIYTNEKIEKMEIVIKKKFSLIKNKKV